MELPHIIEAANVFLREYPSMSRDDAIFMVKLIDQAWNISVVASGDFTRMVIPDNEYLETIGIKNVESDNG
jgi:hypothetical protein